MAHMSRGEGYEDEASDDEDGMEVSRKRRRRPIPTDEYIES